MKEFFFSPITLDQLESVVSKVVTKAIREQPNQIIESQEELLDVHQVAQLLHTTPQNIHAKKRAGQIPFVRFGGRILFKRSEVIESLKSIRVGK